MTQLKPEFILGRESKTPTQSLPKNIPISVPGPSSSTPSTSKDSCCFMIHISFQRQIAGLFTVRLDI